jgi:hypothetical protein
LAAARRTLLLKALGGGKEQREGALLALGGGKAHREAKANAHAWRQQQGAH